MRRDVHPLVDKLAEHLRARRETVSFAESCTGGLLSSMTAALAGVSDVYVGGIVAYSNSVKENLLGVPRPLIKTVGAVSLPVALRMATGVRKSLGSSWAVSITGIAGPGGGTPNKPVGTVCFGIVGPGVEKTVQTHFTGGRHVVQKASAEQALRLLIAELDTELGSEDNEV